MTEQQKDIQRARDMLDRRRKLAIVAQDGDEYRFEPVGTQGAGILWRDFEFFGDQHELVAENVSEGDAALMRLVLHPDLLDAIDVVLAAADVPPVPITVPVILLAQRLAAAIISAEERMNA